MFNKYCLPATGYSRGVVVGLHNVMDYMWFKLLSYQYPQTSNTPTHFFTLRTPTCTHGIHPQPNISILKTNSFKFFTPNFYFLVTSSLTRKPDWLSVGKGGRLGALLLQSLSTKATKHTSVNISVASAPRPESCCSLSAGLQSQPLCGPWQTVLCCAAGHGCSVVGRQQSLHACSSRGAD